MKKEHSTSCRGYGLTGADSYDMDSEGGIKALTLAKDLVDSGAMSKECINWTQGDVMNQFISGNVAMMINWTVADSYHAAGSAGPELECGSDSEG